MGGRDARDRPADQRRQGGRQVATGLELLEACGYEVLLANAGCCQRPRMSKGMVRAARRDGRFQRPVANSLLYEIYRLLPNDTDFSVYKAAGLNGLS